jgi:enamine deaminase RidA (YjgF/YER057c/UK114 family)
MKQNYKGYSLAVWHDGAVWQSTITGPDKRTSSGSWVAASAEEVMQRLRAVVDELLEKESSAG